MKRKLYEKVRTCLAKTPDETLLIAYIAGIGLVAPFAITGAAYALAYSIERIPKVVEFVRNNPLIEYVNNNPYEALLGVAGLTVLGIGTYKYIERKLHVAETLDDFVEKAKICKKPVEVQFQYGRGLGSYDKSITLRAGKIRYEHVGKVETFGSGPENIVNSPAFPPDALQNVMINDGISHARGKAVGVLSLIEMVINLAEDLEKKGLEVGINGNGIIGGPITIAGAKEYLAACKDYIAKGYAFIAG